MSTQVYGDVQQLLATNGKVITCKAAVAWEAKKPLDVTEIQVDVPKKGEVRIKVLSNALCHTDVYTLDGHDPEGLFPCIPGHEATAVVESVGEGVQSVRVGDLVIPCYTPECREATCIFCQSKKTNLCPKIRATQGKGLMPDGSTRFSKDGKAIYHFMGCSTFAEYSVIAEISAAKINPQADVDKVCLLGCGVSTGWGAVWNNVKMEGNSSVVVFGLGAVGLAVVQAAKLAGARLIVGVDVNSNKKAISEEFGVTEFVNPKELNGTSVKDYLLQREKWGYDYTFDCTGNTEVMRSALELAHRGWGESCVIGVAASGHELATRPFQLVTGRIWKGTAFGGWKSRSEVPLLVNRVVTGELQLDKFVTHTFDGLEHVNKSIDVLHSGECLRAVVRISTQERAKKNEQAPKILSRQRVFAGELIRASHWSDACHCTMTFSVYVPDTTRSHYLQPLPPVLLFLSGLTCTDDNARTKMAIYEVASEYRIAILFPDTSPRGAEVEKIENIAKDWWFGLGAGFYVNATEGKYSPYFQMFSYVNDELPAIVGRFFAVDASRISITGQSMGGHGALISALRNPGKYKSVSAFAPISNPVQGQWGRNAFEKYLGSVEAGSQYDATEIVRAYKGDPAARQHFLVDQGLDDQFLRDNLKTYNLKQACDETGWNATFRFHQGYDHSFFFYQTFIRSHIEYHALYLGAQRQQKL